MKTWRFLPFFALALAMTSLAVAGDDPTTPPTVPPADPAPPVETAPAETGAQVLDRCVTLMSAGSYEEVLALALPAITKYPELAPSFQAVVQVATDQIERGRDSAPTATPTPTGSTRVDVPYPKRYKPRAARDHRSRLLVGFDAGLPSGLRAEWDLNGNALDSVGVRVGGNLVQFYGAYPVTDSTVYADFVVAKNLQIETSFGMMVYYGWPYAQGGAALQYDPEGPFQAQLGARVAPEGSVLPDAGVSFVW